MGLIQKILQWQKKKFHIEKEFEEKTYNLEYQYKSKWGASLRVAYQLCNRAGERAKVESQRK